MTSSPDFTWLFIKMLAGLFLVLGLAVILIRVVLPRTRLGRQRVTSWGNLLGRLPIEPQKSLYLVKITGRYLVLGVTEHSIHLVSELSQAEGEKIEAS